MRYPVDIHSDDIPKHFIKESGLLPLDELEALTDEEMEDFCEKHDLWRDTPWFYVGDMLFCNQHGLHDYHEGKDMVTGIFVAFECPAPGFEPNMSEDGEGIISPDRISMRLSFPRKDIRLIDWDQTM